MTRFSILLGTLVIMFVGACITPAEVDFAEAEQELVVYSHFGVDEPMKIYLTHTRDPLTNVPFNPVEHATIKVYKDGMPVGEFHRSEPGKKAEYLALYRTDVYAMAGSRYEIEVIAEGYKNARSAETVPSPGAYNVHFQPVENNEQSTLYRLSFYDDSAENYYQLIINFLEKDMSGSIVSEEVVDYELVRSSAFTHFENDDRTWTAIYPEYTGFLFTGIRGEGNTKELFVEIPNKTGTSSEYECTYKAELHNVSEAYFLYHESVQAQLTANPLTAPTHIYNNIEGGFGNFSSYNTTTAEADAFRIRGEDD